MISVYMSCYELCEAHIMEDMLNDVMIQFGEEQTASDLHSVEACFRDPVLGIPEIIIYELRNSEDFRRLHELRNLFPAAQLMMINRSRIPSLKLLEPGINPAVLTDDFPDKASLKGLMREMVMRIYRDREELSIRDRLLIKQGDELIILRYSQIMYIEAKDKYIIVHFRKGSISYRDTLKTLERKLPPCFVRCHRSIIVNLLFVSKVHLSMRHITMEDGTLVPLSKSYKNKLSAELISGLMD